MKKLLVLISVLVVLVSSVCNAFAVSPDYLPHVQAKFGESVDDLKVGYGEDGGIVLQMPDGHDDMVITFYWNEGGIVDFKFYDYSGRVVWDSYKDAFISGFGISTHAYSLGRGQRVRTYEIGDNVKQILVYCSEEDQECTYNSGFNAGFEGGIEGSGPSVKGVIGYSSGKSCTEMYYYASFGYGNVRQK